MFRRRTWNHLPYIVVSGNSIRHCHLHNLENKIIEWRQQKMSIDRWLIFKCFICLPSSASQRQRDYIPKKKQNENRNVNKLNANRNLNKNYNSNSFEMCIAYLNTATVGTSKFIGTTSLICIRSNKILKCIRFYGERKREREPEPERAIKKLSENFLNTHCM